MTREESFSENAVDNDPQYIEIAKSIVNYDGYHELKGQHNLIASSEEFLDTRNTLWFQTENKLRTQVGWPARKLGLNNNDDDAQILEEVLCILKARLQGDFCAYPADNVYAKIADYLFFFCYPTYGAFGYSLAKVKDYKENDKNNDGERQANVAKEYRRVQFLLIQANAYAVAEELKKQKKKRTALAALYLKQANETTWRMWGLEKALLTVAAINDGFIAYELGIGGALRAITAKDLSFLTKQVDLLGSRQLLHVLSFGVAGGVMLLFTLYFIYQQREAYKRGDIDKKTLRWRIGCAVASALPGLVAVCLSWVEKAAVAVPYLFGASLVMGTLADLREIIVARAKYNEAKKQYKAALTLGDVAKIKQYKDQMKSAKQAMYQWGLSAFKKGALLALVVGALIEPQPWVVVIASIVFTSLAVFLTVNHMLSKAQKQNIKAFWGSRKNCYLSEKMKVLDALNTQGKFKPTYMKNRMSGVLLAHGDYLLVPKDNNLKQYVAPENMVNNNNGLLTNTPNENDNLESEHKTDENECDKDVRTFLGATHTIS